MANVLLSKTGKMELNSSGAEFSQWVCWTLSGTTFTQVLSHGRDFHFFCHVPDDALGLVPLHSS
jgi:hypothetical protein